VPTLQKENEFYVMMLGYLLGYIFKNSMINNYDDIVIITDNLPINKRRKAVEKAIKKVLKEKLQNKKFRICHHNSCSHFMLQVTDYCSWAIFRKHERKDCDYYNKISKFIKSEFEIFSKGTTKHY
jgi:predicted nucleotidyltransferase